MSTNVLQQKASLTKTKNRGKMMNKKKEVTNWNKARKQKNTNWHQICHKIPQKNTIFCSVKNETSKGGTVLTLEVVLKLTLERLKRGTKTNSPAYIYIHTLGVSLKLKPYIL